MGRIIDYPSAGQIPRPFRFGRCTVYAYAAVGASLLIDATRLSAFDDYDGQWYSGLFAASLAAAGAAAALVAMFCGKGRRGRFGLPLIAVLLSLIAVAGSSFYLIH